MSDVEKLARGQPPSVLQLRAIALPGMIMKHERETPQQRWGDRWAGTYVLKVRKSEADDDPPRHCAGCGATYYRSDYRPDLGAVPCDGCGATLALGD